MVGVLAGVGGLVITVALGAGARYEIDRAIGLLGASTLVVRALGDASIALDRTMALERLLGAELVDRVVSSSRVSGATVAGTSVPAVKIVSTERGYLDANGLRIADGRFLAWSDADRSGRVCVLGDRLARDLFPRGGAVGARVRLGDTWHTVVGVLAPQGDRADFAAGLVPDSDRSAFVPWRPGASGGRIDELRIRFDPSADMAAASAAVRRIMEYADPNPKLEYVLPIDLVKQQYRMQNALALGFGGVTLVLLLVGGVSITNVMFLSVTRRKGEIGLRRAVGASEFAILRQFMVEAVLVCGAGGLLGLVAGLVGALLVAELGGWPIGGLGRAAGLGLVASIALGLLAGGYPAWQAARMEPMRALAN